MPRAPRIGPADAARNGHWIMPCRVTPGAVRRVSGRAGLAVQLLGRHGKADDKRALEVLAGDTHAMGAHGGELFVQCGGRGGMVRAQRGKAHTAVMGAVERTEGGVNFTRGATGTFCNGPLMHAGFKVRHVRDPPMCAQKRAGHAVRDTSGPIPECSASAVIRVQQYREYSWKWCSNLRLVANFDLGLNQCLMARRNGQYSSMVERVFVWLHLPQGCVAARLKRGPCISGYRVL